MSQKQEDIYLTDIIKMIKIEQARRNNEQERIRLESIGALPKIKQAMESLCPNNKFSFINGNDIEGILELFRFLKERHYETCYRFVLETAIKVLDSLTPCAEQLNANKGEDLNGKIF